MKVATCVLAFVEPSNYQDGADPDLQKQKAVDLRFEAPTVRKLLIKIEEFLDVEPEALLVNACGDPGRVDVSRIENDFGDPPNFAEKDAWTSGETDLWDAMYSFYIVTDSVVKNFPKKYENQLDAEEVKPRGKNLH